MGANKDAFECWVGKRIRKKESVIEYFHANWLVPTKDAIAPNWNIFAFCGWSQLTMERNEILNKEWAPHPQKKKEANYIAHVWDEEKLF